MLKVTVYRSAWLRGNSTTSRLRNTKGEMCCLGFTMWQAGVDAADLTGHFGPADAYNEGVAICTPTLVKGIRNSPDGVYNTNTCVELMQINDDFLADDAERETKLKEVGKTAGIAFTFKD